MYDYFVFAALSSNPILSLLHLFGTMISYGMQNPKTIDKDHTFKVLVYRNEISSPIFHLPPNESPIFSLFDSQTNLTEESTQLSLIN